MPIAVTQLRLTYWSTLLFLTTHYSVIGFTDFDQSPPSPLDASFCTDRLWSSCVGRCGHGPTTVGPTVGSCACDRKCEIFGDCCADFRTECPDDVVTTTALATNLGRFSCVDVASSDGDGDDVGVLVVDKCAPWWPANESVLRTLCAQVDLQPSADDGHDGLVFRNVHCARCNGYDDTVNWTMSRETDGNVRRCFFHVGSCPESSPSNVSNRCTAYSDPMLVSSNGNGLTRVYKNVHCAICNEKALDRAECPSMSLYASRPTTTIRKLAMDDADEKVPVLAETVSNLMVNHGNGAYLREDIPASFTILFNFGAEGDVKTMFNSQPTDIWSSSKANCADLEIWEPFSKKCRRIYCSSQFQLVGYKCIKVYDNSTIGPGTEVNVANLTDAARMLWQNSSSVNVTLYVQLHQRLSKSITDWLGAHFLHQLARDLDASADRFTNYTLTHNDTVDGHVSDSDLLVDAAISFVLEEPTQGAASRLSEPTVERIVASLSSGISLSHLFMHVNSITLHVVGIAEEFLPPVQSTNGSSTNESSTAAALKSWCDTDAGARTLLYENNDFQAVFRTNDSDDGYNGNAVMDIHILATNMVYHPSEYLASLIFQGSQFQKDVNLSGYVIVCDRPNPNDDCPRIAISPADYVLLSNGSLLYKGDDDLPSIIDVDEYELQSNGEALVCYPVPPSHGETTDQYDAAAFGDEAFGERLLNTVLTSISLVAGLVTFVTYLAFDDLRTLPGVCVMNLTACLWFFQFVFMVGERQSIAEYHPIACRIIAAFVHFTALCYFCWMNIIAIDLYRVFASSKSLLKSTGRSRQSMAVWYFTYAYGIPTLLVGICIASDLVSTESNGAQYGLNGYCWIGNRAVLLLAFASPVFLVLVSNVCLFVVVALAIRRIRQSTTLATSEANGQQHSVKTAVLFFRLCTVLGFTWLLGTFVAVPFKSATLEIVLRYTYIVLNSSHGTAIFVAFVCNRKVLLKYGHIVKRLYGRLRVVEVRAFQHHKVTVPCDHGKVNRTQSNETYRSTLSSCN